MLSALFQLFFPHRCAACSDALQWHESVLCVLCENNLPYTDFYEVKNNRVEQHFDGKIEVTGAALLYFESDVVKPMMHSLKYQKRSKVAELFGKLIAEKIKESTRFSDIDLVIPVPLHPKKEKLRGYNQSWVIAKKIGKELSIASKKHVLTRKQFTSTQTKKSRLERWENVHEVFAVNKKLLAGANKVLLVDDVITTGATAEACLQGLKKEGVKNLFFTSAAMA